MEPAGYSGTPLPRKLGFKDGQIVAFCGLPDDLGWLATSAAFTDVARTGWHDLPPGPRDVIHLFTTSTAELDAALPVLTDRIAPAGAIWISWPKKASKVETDVTEDVIRDLALSCILVDVKVCAVDAIWSGLKLVIRKEYRT
jgi:hypothetical protein